MLVDCSGGYLAQYRTPYLELLRLAAKAELVPVLEKLGKLGVDPSDHVAIGGDRLVRRSLDRRVLE